MKLSRWIGPRPGSVPALFLHIQKTAGTSLIHLARRHYDGSIISHGDYCDTRPDDLVNVRFVSGHFGHAYARQLMSGRYSFTFLRDPVERVLSFYYFCRSRDPHEYAIFRAAHEHDLCGFLDACLDDPFFKMQAWNNQVWQLAYGYTQLDTRTLDDFSPDALLSLAKQHLAEFSHVGLTETFAVDAAIICKALGIPSRGSDGRLPMENVTPLRRSLAEQPPAARALLAYFTELDREIYDFVLGMRRAASRSHSGRWWR